MNIQYNDSKYIPAYAKDFEAIAIKKLNSLKLTQLNDAVINIHPTSLIIYFGKCMVRYMITDISTTNSKDAFILDLYGRNRLRRELSNELNAFAKGSLYSLDAFLPQ